MSKFTDDLIDLGEVGGPEEMDVLTCAFAHLSSDTIVTGKLRLGPEPTPQELLDRLYRQLTADERLWILDYLWNQRIDRKLEELKSRKRTLTERLFGIRPNITCELFKKSLTTPTERVKRILALEGEEQ